MGRLSEERYKNLSATYESEQKDLNKKVLCLEADIAKGEEITTDFEKFLVNVRKYTDVDELTPTIVNEFISKIVIHAPDKSSGKRIQEIGIHYNAVGVINIPTDEEMREMEAEYRAKKQQASKSA